ncbi:MAG: tRNA ((37)-N6)-dimethylallyltransferase MiaA [Solirubrobacteraceae bacterium]|nr:tRNA ((37)-N6)-dimethylallyltransferase MiaA [Solirubrobacteraceae bacterium]
MIAIFGPTGVGKTAVAVALAERLRARGEDPVAVSADALQVYEGLERLTGAASPQERARLEHRLLAFVPVTEAFSAGEYARRAHQEIDGLLAQGRRPIVVGGTGLYLRAALAELDLRPPVDRSVQAALESRPAADLHAELVARAPHLAARLDPADPRRLARSLALLDQGIEYPPAQDELWTSHTRHPTRLIALTMQRDALYAAIDARVDAMVAAGAADEVRRADALGPSVTARQALGFAELLAGDVEAMKQRTRQYARRQLTWLRKLPGAEHHDVTGRSPEDLAADLDSARS